MKLQMRIALATGALALSISPAALAAGKPESVPPTSHGAPGGQGPSYAPSEPTPGPKAGLPAKAKAYGRVCKGESRKHVKGEKGTAFSRCVRDVAHLRREERREARQQRREERKAEQQEGG